MSALLGYENHYSFDTKLMSSWGITGDIRGMLITAKVQQDIQLNSWWRLTPGLQLDWGSSEYMDNYFGISKKESQKSENNLPSYNADAGFRDTRFYMNNTFQIHENIRLYANGYIGFVLDEARKSPLIKNAGSNIAYGGGIGISFKF